MKLFELYKRVFDLVLSTMLLVLFSLPMIVIGIMVLITSSGPAIYWSERVGRNNRSFQMPKFRSMLQETPPVATDQLAEPGRYLSPIGSILRKSSLDELPQLWSIISGDMSFVGPRPALFNQYELITMRKSLGIDKLRPGLTGWAQVNGRDELSSALKVQFDLEYLNCQSPFFDMKIMWMTFTKVISKDGIAH
ncbi:sugar transferase [Polynucleobacter paneuropaeus]|uniref:Sugar transferase n=1 Tax=Polynucleobacter paneuropaeus TaxID=2527775 RepID=A0A9Q2WJQ4_9BURK|nr:sugar transferase [Polynucleobacter paneuropaeus]